MNKLVFLLLGTAAGQIAFASSTVLISFNTLPGTQGNGSSTSQGNVYVGEVGATIAGIAAESLVCDDFEASTLVPSSNIDFSVESISSLSGTNFSGSYATISGDTLTQTQAYDTVALLLTGLEALTVNGTNAQAIADYQYAIWNLMLPGGTDGSFVDNPLDSNATTDQQTAFAAVQANSTATQTDERALVIYTPTAGYTSNQEFIGLNTPTVQTPEPSSWVLMTSLGLLLCVVRVRAQKLMLSRKVGGLLAVNTLAFDLQPIGYCRARRGKP